MSSPRIPTADQLEIIRFQALRYQDARRRRLEALPSGDRTDLREAESHAMLRLKEALTASEADCPYGWPDAIRDALADLVREVAPGPSVVAGHRPRLEYTPAGIPQPIPGRVVGPDALAAAVMELERAIPQDPGNASTVSVSPSPPGPEQVAEHGDDEEVWGNWFSNSEAGLVKAMGDLSKSSAHAVIQRMLIADTLQARPAIAPVNGYHKWEFRIKEPALRERVLKYIADG